MASQAGNETRRLRTALLALSSCSILACSEQHPTEAVLEPIPTIICPPVMTFRRHVDASLTGLRASALTLCRNEACYSLSLAGLGTLDERGVISPNMVEFPSTQEERKASDRDARSGKGKQPHFSAEIEPSLGGGFLLKATLNAQWAREELKDGDVYTVKVRSTQGHSLVDVHRAVTYRRPWRNCLPSVQIQ